MIVEETVKALQAEVKSLNARLTVQEDISAIRKLHHQYGFYIDKCLYAEVIALFSDDCEVHFHGGIYKGKEGASRLYQKWFAKLFVGGRNGPAHGFLLDHFLGQDVITVAEDGKSANHRARCLMQGGLHQSVQQTKARDNPGVESIPPPFYEAGVYENVFVKGTDGKWKIKVLNYKPVWQCTYEDGWHKAPPHMFPPFSKLYPEDPRGPDVLEDDPNGQWFWPDTHVVPFHYAHPITGEQVKEEDMRAAQVQF